MAACEELHDFDRTITASGHYEIGEIRRRRGDFAGAEEAYRTSNELGRDPQPGLSLLRLAEGKVDAAVAGITRALQDATDPLSRLRRLPAQVEIAIATGDLKTARAAADEAEQIVDSYKIGNRRAAAFDATVHDLEARSSSPRRTGTPRSPRSGTPATTGRTSAHRTRRRGLGCFSVPRTCEAATNTPERTRWKARSPHSSGSERESTSSECEELLGRVETRRTFLFTDIVDSTKLLETLGAEKWKRLLARHDEIVRERIVESGGEVVKKTGDGFFACVRQPEGGDRRGDRDPACAGRRDRRPRRQDRRAHGGRVPHRRGLDRLRRPGRACRRADRSGSDRRRDSREHRNARRLRRGGAPRLRAPDGSAEGPRAAHRGRSDPLAVVPPPSSRRSLPSLGSCHADGGYWRPTRE